MKFDLHASAQEKVLVVAHRGAFGGNIPCNTIASFEIALRQGADMVELDVDMSADGKLFIFHPGMEPHHLGHFTSIETMNSEDIANLRYMNFDSTPTQFGIETFDDVLETLKGRCYINVDKFWEHPREIYAAIKQHGMEEQMLVKSSPSPQVIKVLKEMAPELSYMPIVRSTHPLHRELMHSGINYIGAEVLFDSENEEVASPAFIEQMHRDSKLVWANAIIYNYRTQLAAGHSDDTAMCGDPDRGWGWLIDRGFDLIQTDWTRELVNYMKAHYTHGRGTPIKP